MEISDRTRVSGLLQRVARSALDQETKDVLLEVLRGIDGFAQDLVLQFRKQPTIFVVDPSAYPDVVKGAKSGDVAIFKNREGYVDIKQY